MRERRVRSKLIFMLVGVIGVAAILIAGSGATISTLAQESGGGGLPEGFKKSEAPAMPSAEDIEAGKRVYFTKCVWCHGVEGSGDGPSADRLWPRPRNFNQGTFRSGTPLVVSSRCLRWICSRR